jgi:hypothetical protein
MCENMARFALPTIPPRHPRHTIALARPSLALVRLTTIGIAVTGLALARRLLRIPVVAIRAPLTRRARVALLALTAEAGAARQGRAATTAAPSSNRAGDGEVFLRWGTLAWPAGFTAQRIPIVAGRTDVAPGAGGRLPAAQAESGVRFAGVGAAVAETGHGLANQIDDNLALDIALLVVAVEAAPRVLAGGGVVLGRTAAQLHAQSGPGGRQGASAGRPGHIQAHPVQGGHSSIRGICGSDQNLLHSL